VVVSPHFDDAVLSLGATIAAATRSGASVTVLTVLGGDPASDLPAGRWDRTCGFATAGEAAEARRAEDEHACSSLGASHAWLPYSDEQYERGGTDDEIWKALESKLADAEVVLVPGYPLVLRDHEWTTRLLLTRLPTGPRLYVEQPYAADIAIGRGYTPGPLLAAVRVAFLAAARRGLPLVDAPSAISGLLASPVEWIVVPTNRRDRAAKAAAIRAYNSQLRGLGRWVTKRIQLYEAARGGESVGLIGHRLG
jgi:LmbE family N-acetylglucosaminyl deacetylase